MKIEQGTYMWNIGQEPISHLFWHMYTRILNVVFPLFIATFNRFLKIDFAGEQDSFWYWNNELR